MKEKPERRGIHVTVVIKGHIVHFFLREKGREGHGGETRESDSKMRKVEREGGR